MTLLKPSKRRADTMGKYVRVTVPKLADGLVHLAGARFLFNIETQPGKSTHPSAIGTVHGTCEETLCGYSSDAHEKHPRADGAPTCVTCIATWFSRPQDTVE